MTDFFKSNPIALRHCIRFEILQGKSIEQAYSNICTVLGEEVIDFKKFKIRFNHFSKKKFNDKENPCAKILRDDKYALRVCILYEFLKYQRDKLSIPVFEVFVNFCEVIGENVLKYPEFEFWFYRFLNGEYDLNYERDEEKKIYELMDMPIDIMKNVVEYLDIFDRFKLAKTSRSLQTFVEDQKLFHQTLELYLPYSTATVSLGESVYIHYSENQSGCTKFYKNRETNVEGVAYWKQAILDFKKILKNPRLYLDTLEILLYVNIELLFDDLKSALKFTHHLNVKNLILREFSSYLLVEILPMLKPGYFTSIDIDFRNANVDSMEKVLEMEQWKQVKYFKMDGAYFIWSLHHLYHLKEFAIILERLTLENIRQIKEFLFKSPDFEKCSFTLYREIDKSIVAQEFSNALRKGPYVYHFPIVNSTDYFEVKVHRHFFKVTREKN